MSLINEALHKAQNQRHNAPGLNDETNMGHPSVNYAPQPSRIGLMIGLGIFIVILIGLVAGLTIVIMDKSEPQTAQNSETPALPATPNIEPADVVSTELTTAIAPEQQPQIPEALEQSREVIKAPTPEPEPNKEIMDWIEQCTISGVRITSNSSKVILNNKAFIPGDSVNMSLKLKILEIEPERILFIDSNGVEYMKLF